VQWCGTPKTHKKTNIFSYRERERERERERHGEGEKEKIMFSVPLSKMSPTFHSSADRRRGTLPEADVS
jgi:hypothetical protein